MDGQCAYYVPSVSPRPGYKHICFDKYLNQKVSGMVNIADPQIGEQMDRTCCDMSYHIDLELVWT